MESYKVPSSLKDTKNNKGNDTPSKLTPIFRDREELPTRSDLSKAIIDALRESHYLIVICSPESAKSQWVNKEIIDFKQIHGEDRVLAVVVDGEPYAIDKPDRFSPEQESFPEALKYRVDEAGNLTDKRTEPLAADAREIGDGKERAKVKLISGLLGVGFDDLWRREKRRQKQRKIIVTTTVSLVFIVISMLSIFSVLQWKEAEYQKKIAIEGREAAESLIDHTLFDLRDKLEPIGQLELLYSTQKAVDEYYEKLSNLNMSSEIEFRLSAYHSNSGHYFKSIGKTRKAKEHFESAIKLMKRVVKKDPNDTLQLRNLAVSYSKLGSIEESLDKKREAKEYFELSQKILQNIAKDEPSNYHLQFDLAKSYGKLGNLLRHFGKSNEAQKNFEIALDMMQKLFKHDPLNVQWQQDIAVTHTSFGVLLKFLDKPTKALEHFKAAQVIRKKLVEDNPSNFLYKHSLSESYSYLGDIYLSYLDRPKDAKKYIETALDIMAKLTEHDPSNSQWKHSLARSYHKLGDVQLHLDKQEVALNNYDMALQIIQNLVKDDSYNLNLQHEFALECGKIGNLQLHLDKPQKAKKHFERALSTMQKLAKEDPSIFLYQYTLAIVYSDLSDLYRHKFGQISLDSFYSDIENIQKENDKLEKGLRYFEESLRILKKLKKDDPTNPLWRR